MHWGPETGLTTERPEFGILNLKLDLVEFSKWEIALYFGVHSQYFDT